MFKQPEPAKIDWSQFKTHNQRVAFEIVFWAAVLSLCAVTLAKGPHVPITALDNLTRALFGSDHLRDFLLALFGLPLALFKLLGSFHRLILKKPEKSVDEYIHW